MALGNDYPDIPQFDAYAGDPEGQARDAANAPVVAAATAPAQTPQNQQPQKNAFLDYMNAVAKGIGGGSQQAQAPASGKSFSESPLPNNGSELMKQMGGAGGAGAAGGGGGCGMCG